MIAADILQKSQSKFDSKIFTSLLNQYSFSLFFLLYHSNVPTIIRNVLKCLKIIIKFISIEEIISPYNILYYKYINADLPELDEQIKQVIQNKKTLKWYLKLVE